MPNDNQKRKEGAGGLDSVRLDSCGVELVAGDGQSMGYAVGLVLGANGGMRQAVEGEGEGKRSGV